MSKEKEPKSNVMRILEREKIPYRQHFYEHEDGKIDGLSVAEKLSENPDRVFKTLVTRGAGGGFYVFLIPAERELSLKAAARSVGEKSVELIRVDELFMVTGYVRGGCSPIGMKKQYPTVVDESCLSQSVMLVSAGRIGAQAELAPSALLRLVRAKTALLTE